MFFLKSRFAATSKSWCRRSVRTKPAVGRQPACSSSVPWVLGSPASSARSSLSSQEGSWTMPWWAHLWPDSPRRLERTRIQQSSDAPLDCKSQYSFILFWDLLTCGSNIRYLCFLLWIGCRSRLIVKTRLQFESLFPNSCSPSLSRVRKGSCLRH